MKRSIWKRYGYGWLTLGWFLARDTLEHRQSEFLQLLWQIGGLALLLYLGSPQSKEGDDRMERVAPLPP